MNYMFKTKVFLNFREAINRVKEELKKEGFGILTEIDVKKTLKEKLEVDYEEYVILGACNPTFAYKTLQMEKDIGLLLPCNVIVYVDKGENYISVINPVGAMSITNNEKLREVAEKVGKKLKRIIDNFEKEVKNKWDY